MDRVSHPCPNQADARQYRNEFIYISRENIEGQAFFVCGLAGRVGRISGNAGYIISIKFRLNGPSPKAACDTNL